MALSPVRAEPSEGTTPPFSRLAKCDDNTCGQVEVDIYRPAKGKAETGGNVGGADIKATFRPVKSRRFRIIQAVVVDDAPTKFHDGTPIEAPYVDPPPGGYRFKPADHAPYYGMAKVFLTWEDAPRCPLDRTAIPADDRVINVKFETWLVCEIRAEPGDDEQKASDDSYRVAPLLGWTWGYAISYTPDGDANPDELEDFTVTVDSFCFTDSPSTEWKNALKREYGADESKDRFRVSLGSCRRCPDAFQVPKKKGGGQFCALDATSPPVIGPGDTVPVTFDPSRLCAIDVTEDIGCVEVSGEDSTTLSGTIVAAFAASSVPGILQVEVTDFSGLEHPRISIAGHDIQILSTRSLEQEIFFDSNEEVGNLNGFYLVEHDAEVDGIMPITVTEVGGIGGTLDAATGTWSDLRLQGCYVCSAATRPPPPPEKPVPALGGAWRATFALLLVLATWLVYYSRRR